MVTSSLSPKVMIGVAALVVMLASCSSGGQQAQIEDSVAVSGAGSDVPKVGPGAGTERSEVSELYAERAASLAQEYGVVDAPQIDIVRAVPPEEHDQVHAQCLGEAGWGTTILPDGGVAYDDYAAEQQEAFNLALYTCLVQFPPIASELGGMDEEQWSVLYDHLVEDVVPCAEREGFDVGEVPTRETYLAQPEGQKWFPALEIAMTISDGGSARYTSVGAFNEVCPPSPQLSEDLSG